MTHNGEIIGLKLEKLRGIKSDLVIAQESHTHLHIERHIKWPVKMNTINPSS